MCSQSQFALFLLARGKGQRALHCTTGLFGVSPPPLVIVQTKAAIIFSLSRLEITEIGEKRGKGRTDEPG